MRNGGRGRGGGPARFGVVLVLTGMAVFPLLALSPSDPDWTPVATNPAADPGAGSIGALAPQPTPSVAPADEPPTDAETSAARTSTATTAPPQSPTEIPSTAPSSTAPSSATETTSTPPPTTAPPAAPVRPATEPVVSSEEHSPALTTIAVVVLVLAALAVVGLARSARREPDRAPAARPDPATSAGPGASTTDAVVLMAVVGEAMLDSGYDVDSVRSAVEDVAAVNGVPRAQIIALPTAMVTSALAGGRLETIAIATDSRALLLHQVEDLNEVITAARHGEIDPVTARARIQAIRALRPLFGPGRRLVGNMLAAAGLAVLLGGSWTDVTVAAGMGAVVGLLLRPEVPPRVQVLLVVIATFTVATSVFLLARAGLPLVVLPSLIAPLVTLLPGTLLTTGVVELSTGEMISGAGRMAAGTIQLLLLALGITSGAALVGVPAIDLGSPPSPLGPFAPWVAVAVFGLGVLVNRCAHPRAMGWVLIVLYVAYSAQVAGSVFFGGVLSAFIGAATMTPVAVLISRQRTGTPAIVSFLPAYWLLVPGALGLVGVAALLGGDTTGVTTLVTTATTMVAISLGVLVGTAISRLAGSAATRWRLRGREG